MFEAADNYFAKSELTLEEQKILYGLLIRMALFISATLQMLSV